MLQWQVCQQHCCSGNERHHKILCRDYNSNMTMMWLPSLLCRQPIWLNGHGDNNIVFFFVVDNVALLGGAADSSVEGSITWGGWRQRRPRRHHGGHSRLSRNIML